VLFGVGVGDFALMIGKDLHRRSWQLYTAGARSIIGADVWGFLADGGGWHEQRG
jgi:hypothetical protein